MIEDRDFGRLEARVERLEGLRQPRWPKSDESSGFALAAIAVTFAVIIWALCSGWFGWYSGPWYSGPWAP